MNAPLSSEQASHGMRQMSDAELVAFLRMLAASKTSFEGSRELLQAADALEGYAGWARSVNEALNSGDGSYRP